MSIIPDDKKEAVKERILANCEADPATGCWVWNGRIEKGKYANLQLNGNKVMAPKASYLAHVGPVGDNYSLIKTCGNTLCVNPNHMFPQRKTGGTKVTLGKIKEAVRELGGCARAVDVAEHLELPRTTKTLEAIELILEDDPFVSDVVYKRKFYSLG